MSKGTKYWICFTERELSSVKLARCENAPIVHPNCGTYEVSEVRDKP